MRTNNNKEENEQSKEDKMLAEFKEYLNKNKDAIMKFLNRDTNVLEDIKTYCNYQLKIGADIFTQARNAAKQGAVEYAKELIDRESALRKERTRKHVIMELATNGYKNAAQELRKHYEEQGIELAPLNSSNFPSDNEKQALQGNETEKRHYCLFSPWFYNRQLQTDAYNIHVAAYVKKTTFLSRLFHSPGLQWVNIGSSGPAKLLTYLKNKECRKLLLVVFFNYFAEKDQLDHLDFTDSGLFLYACEAVDQHNYDLLTEILPHVITQDICDNLQRVESLGAVNTVIQWFIKNKKEEELRQLKFSLSSHETGSQKCNILTVALYLTDKLLKHSSGMDLMSNEEDLKKDHEEIVKMLLHKGVDALCKYDNHPLKNSTCMFFVDDYDHDRQRKKERPRETLKILVEHIKCHPRGYDFFTKIFDKLWRKGSETRTLLNYIDNANDIIELIESGVRLPQNHEIRVDGLSGDRERNEVFRRSFSTLVRLQKRAQDDPESIEALKKVYNEEIELYRSYVEKNKQSSESYDTNVEICKALNKDEKELMTELGLHQVLPVVKLVKAKEDIQKKALPRLYLRLANDRIDIYFKFHKTLTQHISESDYKIPEVIISLIGQYLSIEDIDKYMQAMQKSSSETPSNLKSLEDKKPPKVSF